MRIPDDDELRDWIGRSEHRTDHTSAAPLMALGATLDRTDPEPQRGSAVPPLWHWLYFTPRTRRGELGPDGHAKRGDFLPPIRLPRRMWAGGRLEFHRPLRVGCDVSRTSRIADVRSKSGRSGALCFVEVVHQIADERGLAITESHDIVYRGDESGPEPTPATATAATPAVKSPLEAEFSQQVLPDPVLLFRYSALTFNGHRIHFDRDYATRVEGYPGLVVHGPLIATLLLELLRREQPQAGVRRFDFKALRPLFDIEPFSIHGRSEGGDRFRLWAANGRGDVAMEATAELGRTTPTS